MSLIVLEGLDGSGKGTQAGLLLRAAEARGKARRISFPDYDSPSSALVKMYLSGAFGTDAEQVNAYAASTFYAVDRFASYQLKWKDAYLSGETIVADRYVTSNLVFQLTKLPRGEWDAYIRWLEDLEYEKLALPRPDAVIYLDVDPSVSQSLLMKRYGGEEEKRDIHEADLAFQQNCRTAALYAAEKLRWDTLSCYDGETMQTPEEIHRKILNILEAYL